MENLIGGSNGPDGVPPTESLPHAILAETPMAEGDGSGADNGNGGNGGNGGPKLNANAIEFVPLCFKKETEDDDDSTSTQALARPFLNVNAPEFMPRQKKEAMTQINCDSDEDLGAWEEQMANEKLMLPWKGFPRKLIKVGHASQVVLLNDKEYMIVPCKKAPRPFHEYQVPPPPPPPPAAAAAAAAQTSEETSDENVWATFPNYPPNGGDPNAEERRHVPERRSLTVEERRREQERRVAVEALQLAEQRRAREPWVSDAQSNGEDNSEESPRPPRLVYHLSRSPIRYSPRERIRVDALRSAKKERIENILREMSLERKREREKLLQDLDSLSITPSSSPSNSNPNSARRYIPTAKQWDEQRRAKLQAKRDQAKTTATTTTTTTQQDQPSPMEMPVEEIGDQAVAAAAAAKRTASASPRYMPPGEMQPGERRKGNLTHWKRMPIWKLQNPQEPLSLVDGEGKIIVRYTVEELLQLEPQPEDLDMLIFDEKLLQLGFLAT